MSSSWTDAGRDGQPPRFLSVDRGSLTRLAVVLAFAAAAFVGPFLGTTSARFTDSTELGVTFSVPAEVPPLPPLPPLPPVAPDPDPVPDPVP